MTDPILSQLGIVADSRVPKYLQLQRQLEAMIADGVWSQNRRLPSETAIASALGISIMTVRQAMSALVNKGIIVRNKGRGTFVLPHDMLMQAPHLRSFTEDVRARSGTPSSRILTFEHMLPPLYVAEYLNVPADQAVLYIRRLRMRDNQAVAVHSAYISYTDITREEIDQAGSLYAVLEHKGFRLTEAQENIRAMSATEELAGLLGVEPGAALLRVTRTTMDSNFRPLEHSVAKCRGDLFEYSFKLFR